MQSQVLDLLDVVMPQRVHMLPVLPSVESCVLCVNRVCLCQDSSGPTERAHYTSIGTPVRSFGPANIYTAKMALEPEVKLEDVQH